MSGTSRERRSRDRPPGEPLDGMAPRPGADHARDDRIGSAKCRVGAIERGQRQQPRAEEDQGLVRVCPCVLLVRQKSVIRASAPTKRATQARSNPRRGSKQAGASLRGSTPRASSDERGPAVAKGGLRRVRRRNRPLSRVSRRVVSARAVTSPLPAKRRSDGARIDTGGRRLRWWKLVFASRRHGWKSPRRVRQTSLG